MYVEELSLREFRAIHRSSISFLHPGSPGADRREFPNINLLVGSNGGGKSTVLKGIAAAALGRFVDLEAATDRSILGWPRIGATDACTARVTLRLADGDDRGTLAEEGIQIARDRDVPRPVTSVNDTSVAGRDDLVLFAYGARRATGSYDRRLAARDRDDPGRRVGSLFSESFQLVPPEQVVLDPETDAARPELLDTVNALMPPDTLVLGDIDEDGRLLVESRDLQVPWTLLSDGAQSYLAWLFDLVHGLDQVAIDGDVHAVRGAVLVDEIDQRMHPRWQQALLEQLSGGLPSLQFICSAHSPLVAAGLRGENLTLLEPDHDAPGEGAMQAIRLAEDLFGRTADGVLTSSYFNLTSTRSDRFRRELLGLAAAGLDHDDAAVEFIRTMAAGSAGSQPRARAPIIDRPERFQKRRS